MVYTIRIAVTFSYGSILSMYIVFRYNLANNFEFNHIFKYFMT